MHFILKKILILVLCLAIVLSGCGKLEKAEPFYSESNENVVFETEYKYYFDDELTVNCHWSNSGDEDLCFMDPFELHVLGDDGEWYKLSLGEEVEFMTNYCHGLDAGTVDSNARYDLSVYTENLENGKTYRISTYCYNEEETDYYQVFAEFTCDNALAEEEIQNLTEGAASRRDNLEDSESPLEILGGED